LDLPGGELGVQKKQNVKMRMPSVRAVCDLDDSNIPPEADHFPHSLPGPGRGPETPPFEHLRADLLEVMAPTVGNGERGEHDLKILVLGRGHARFNVDAFPLRDLRGAEGTAPDRAADLTPGDEGFFVLQGELQLYVLVRDSVTVTLGLTGKREEGVQCPPHCEPFQAQILVVNSGEFLG
jgi:hypothetical protein